MLNNNEQSLPSDRTPLADNPSQVVFTHDPNLLNPTVQSLERPFERAADREDEEITQDEILVHKNFASGAVARPNGFENLENIHRA